MTAASTYRPRPGALLMLRPALILVLGEAEFRSRKKTPADSVPAHASAAAIVWLAVTADMTSSAVSTAAMGDAASVTPWVPACALIDAPAVASPSVPSSSSSRS